MANAPPLAGVNAGNKRRAKPVVAKKPQNLTKAIEKVGFRLSGLPNVGTIRSSFPEGRRRVQ
jgi:hypothetical protein